MANFDDLLPRSDSWPREATVLMGIQGYFQVYDSHGETWRAQARGKLRHGGDMLLVGERVRLDLDESGQVMVTEALPRKSTLLRPAVANVDQVLLIFACSQPAPHWLLLDRLLIMAQRQGVKPAIFLNKSDLVSPRVVATFTSHYQHSGFPLVVGSIASAVGLEELHLLLQGRISVLAGPSGAGKSSLLNALYPQWQLATGSVSKKIGRGKHTTRLTQLLTLPSGGMVADTPGFTSFDGEAVSSRELARLYPEMVPGIENCRFASCLHQGESECGVKDLLAQGLVSDLRYNNYLKLLQEMLQKEKRY